MKRTILSVVVLSTMIFTACKKETPQPQEIFKNDVTVKEEKTTFFLNGVTPIEIANFKKTDNTSTVIIDSKTAFIFENDTELLKWANDNSRDNNSNAKEIVISKTKQLYDFRNEAKRLGVSDDEDQMEKLLNSMMSESSSRAGGGFAWEHDNQSGDALQIWTPYPKLNNKWDNQISSVTTIGGTVLCDYRWFGGEKVYLIINLKVNLGESFNFNDRTSSIM